MSAQTNYNTFDKRDDYTVFTTTEAHLDAEPLVEAWGNELLEMVDVVGGTAMIVDLTHTLSTSSSVVRYMILLRDWAREHQCGLGFVVTNETLLYSLRLTKLDTILIIDSSAEKVLARCRHA